MAVGMTFRNQRLDLRIFDKAKGLSITLAFFILDNTALIIELFLSDRAKEITHPVAFQPERLFKRGLGHGLEIIGPVKPGRPVKISRADGLKGFKEIPGGVF